MSSQKTDGKSPSGGGGQGASESSKSQGSDSKQEQSSGGSGQGNSRKGSDGGKQPSCGPSTCHSRPGYIRRGFGDKLLPLKYRLRGGNAIETCTEFYEVVDENGLVIVDPENENPPVNEEPARFTAMSFLASNFMNGDPGFKGPFSFN